MLSRFLDVNDNRRTVYVFSCFLTFVIALSMGAYFAMMMAEDHTFLDLLHALWYWAGAAEGGLALLCFAIAVCVLTLWSHTPKVFLAANVLAGVLVLVLILSLAGIVMLNRGTFDAQLRDGFARKTHNESNCPNMSECCGWDSPCNVLDCNLKHETQTCKEAVLMEIRDCAMRAIPSLAILLFVVPLMVLVAPYNENHKRTSSLSHPSTDGRSSHGGGN